MAKRARYICAAVFLALLSVCCREAAGEGSIKQAFTVLYTAQSRGQIRSCDCNKFRYGGLGRATTYIRSIRELTSDLIAVEGGDFLAKDSQEGRLKAGVFAKYMRMMRYAAVVPGEREAFYQAGYLREMDKEIGGIFTCANMQDAEGKESLFRPYIVAKLPCGLRIGVIGVLDPKLLAPVGKLPGTPVLVDPSEALKKYLPGLKKESDITLLIAHASSSQAERFAEIARTDVTISTHGSSRERPIAEGETEVSKPTVEVAGSIFFESATQWAWSVGTLDLTVDGDKVVKHDNKVVYLGRAVQEDPEMITVYNDHEAKTKKLAQERKEMMTKQLQESIEARASDAADDKD